MKARIAHRTAREQLTDPSFELAADGVTFVAHASPYARFAPRPDKQRKRYTARHRVSKPVRDREVGLAILTPVRLAEDG